MNTKKELNEQTEIPTRQGIPVWAFSCIFCAIFFSYASLLLFLSLINNPAMINAKFITWAVFWFGSLAVILFFVGTGAIIICKKRGIKGNWSNHYL